jgi:dTDP-4-amino-4,6-dideoxygalactose transaminase
VGLSKYVVVPEKRKRMTLAIPFHKPSISRAEERAVLAVLRSGWLTSGEVAERFENEFRNWLGTSAISVSSASAGLQLTYAALKRRGVSDVVVPSLTFTSTAMGAVHAGLNCRIVDVDEQTLCLDPKYLTDLGAPEVAVTAVHYGGFVSKELRAQLAELSSSGVPVIEDAAHALPASDEFGYVGAGSVSTSTVFSFYANKTVTSGEGGMVCVSDPSLAEDMRLLRQHGIDRNSYFRRFTSVGNSWDYEVLEPGFKANLPDLLAAIGLVQFRRRFELQRMRAKVARSYFEVLSETDIILPPHSGDFSNHAWHLFVVRMPATVNRDAVMARLKSRGIGCSLHYRPLHRHRYYMERFSLDPRSYPKSEAAFQSAISLPIYPDLTLSQVEWIASVLIESVKSS